MSQLLGIFLWNKDIKWQLFFIKVLDDFPLSEVMLFERMLFHVYKGIFFAKFTDKKQYGEKLIQDSLLILKLANCNNLYDILLEDSNRLLFNIWIIYYLFYSIV